MLSMSLDVDDWDSRGRIKSDTRGKVEDFHESRVAPKEGYEPPDSWKDFVHLDEIGLDIETRDPELGNKGPGCYRRDGFVVGVGIAYNVEHAVYYPVGHTTNTNRNIKRLASFWDWFRDQAQRYKGTVVGANLAYDLDWLAAAHDVRFPHARIEDVQWAEALLDENRLKYSLEVLAQEYLGDGKRTDELKKYGEHYILNMHRIDPGHAGEYCEDDAIKALRIIAKQRPRLTADGLDRVWDLECRGAHILLEMRRRGVRIDLDRANQASQELRAEVKAGKERLREMIGFGIDPWSADSLERGFDKLGLQYPRTKPSKNFPKGKPSFRKAWLQAHTHEFAREIVFVREMDKTAGTFVESYILDGHVNGRLHTQFHPLKGDTNGTVSGRYSSSNPNLQNIPARHPKLGPLMRSMFIPEEDHDWGSADWSQIEYRLLAHVCDAVPSVDSAELIRRYRSDPTTDFHVMAAEIAGVDRKTAKNINFGVVYGMGVPALAMYLGVPIDEAEKILAEFHARAPYLRGVYDWAGRRANSKGYVKTLLGRRRRFTDYVVGYGQRATFFKDADEAAEHAIKTGSVVQRAGTHKALNAILQGSAADLMKQAMVNAWEAGLFAEGLLIPHLTVHDEMNVSVPRTRAGREAFDEMRRIMETAVELAVPVLVDAKLGATWDEAK